MSDDEPDNLEPAEAMMAEVPGAEMTESEADEIFSAAWEGDEADEANDASDDDGESGAEVTRLDEARGDDPPSDGGHWRGSIAAAAAVLLATAGVWVGYRWIAGNDGDQTTYTGVKSPDEAPEVELIPLAGRMESGRPAVGKRLEEGTRLEPGIRVLFRYRLSRRASVVLLGQQQGGEVEVLWRSESPQPARELEVRANGRALALDPARYDGAFRLAMVAGPDDGLPEATAIDSLDEATIRKACSSCGVDIVQLETP